MFYGCSALKTIEDISLSELRNGSYMFYQTGITQGMVQKNEFNKIRGCFLYVCI